MSRSAHSASESLLLSVVADAARDVINYLKLDCAGIMTIQVNITPNGRMSLPADIRKRLGLTDGGAVYLDETDDGVILRTVPQIVAQAQALARRYRDAPGSNVDAFLADRMAENGE